jgi:probable HAF family extracellular repeat protein
MGQVVGTFLVPSFTSRYESHAFLYDSVTGVMQDLNALLPSGFSNSYATAINNNGQILINADLMENGVVTTHAFLLSDGVLQDLNDLMPNGGWLANYATDLNNIGQIAGIGSQFQQSAAFLMAPRGVQKSRPTLRTDGNDRKHNGKDGNYDGNDD